QQLISGVGGNSSAAQSASAGAISSHVMAPSPAAPAAAQAGPAPSSTDASAGRPTPPVVLGGIGEQVAPSIPSGTNSQASPLDGNVRLAAPGPSTSPAGNPAPATSPIHFLEARGQEDPAAQFVASSRSLSASFEEHAIELQVGERATDSVRLEFEGASSA